MIVLGERQQPVQCIGKAPFGSCARFIFLPERHQLIALIRRQQPKDPLGRGRFNGLLVASRLLVIDKGVIGVDLDNVMHQHNLDHPPHIDRFIRIIGQQDRHHRQVPTMLRRIFITRHPHRLGPA